MSLEGRKRMAPTMLINNFLFLFCLFAGLRRYSGATVTYCYFGNIENQNFFLNETCATGEKRLTNVQSQNQNNTTSSPQTGAPQNMSHVTSSVSVTHCIIFKYFINKNLIDQNNVLTKDTSVYANFSCDYKSLCAGKGTERINNITYNGFTGDVFCCDKDNCNTRHTAMQDLPPYQQLCYTGSNMSTVPTGSLSSCDQPGSMCAYSLTSNKDGKSVASYFCDSVLCNHNNMTQTWNGTCKTVQVGNVTTYLCCCWKNRCYKPPWPMHEPLNNSTPSSPSSPIPGLNWVVTGIIIAMSLLLGVGFGALATIAVYRRRTKAEKLTMTYHRIAADDPLHGDNVQMIV